MSDEEKAAERGVPDETESPTAARHGMTKALPNAGTDAGPTYSEYYNQQPLYREWRKDGTTPVLSARSGHSIRW